MQTRRFFVTSIVSASTSSRILPVYGLTTTTTTTTTSSHLITRSFLTSIITVGTEVRQHRSNWLSSSTTAMMSSSNDDATITTSTTTTNTTTMNSPLFLFDFDGVVCDSCDECTVSALRTLHQLGIHTKKKNYNDEDDDNPALPDYPPDWLFHTMRDLRPAIEVGWQIPVLLSIVWEQQQQQQHGKQQAGDQQADDENKRAVVVSVDEILANYESLVSHWLQVNQLTDQDMIDTFGQVRDDWIETDLPGWLRINTFYPQVPESLNHCSNSIGRPGGGKSVLVTTKQQRFAIALCRHAGITEKSLPDALIYGLGQYKNKADVIVEQMKGGTTSHAPSRTHFFEDRWPTLVKCLKDPRLDGVQLYLCSWGYVTAHELALAEAEPRVQVIGLEQFVHLVQGRQ
jgi:phosphoglycolate phosphatase-like HAD superfamily hydrolase